MVNAGALQSNGSQGVQNAKSGFSLGFPPPKRSSICPACRNFAMEINWFSPG
jgi:hypothetical protein